MASKGIGTLHDVGSVSTGSFRDEHQSVRSVFANCGKMN